MKEQALEKMLKEMLKKHSPAEDSIHNWLCEQEDEELIQGILKEGRTIKGAMQYCIEQAKKIETGNAAMVDDPTVFGWVRDYFTAKEVKKEKVAVVAEVKVSNESENKAVKASGGASVKSKRDDYKKGDVEQLDLFDFL